MVKKADYETIIREREKDPVKSTWSTWTKGESTEAARNIRLAYHNELEFHYIKRGSGFYFIKNRKHRFEKNSLITIKPGQIHAFFPGETSCVEKGSLYFLPSLIKDKKLKFTAASCPGIINLSEKEATLIEILLKNVAEELHDRKDFWTESVYACIALFLSMVKRGAKRRDVPVEKNPLADKIIGYIENNFTRNLSLADISRAFSLSNSRISHIFKQETGLSLKSYILQRRIVEAKKLLAEKERMKVSTISSKVGFSCFALFNRSFKKITGLTPTAYRKGSR